MLTRKAYRGNEFGVFLRPKPPELSKRLATCLSDRNE